MSFNISTNTKIIMGLLSISLLSSCGKIPSFVSNANVNFREDANQQQFVDVTTSLNTGLASMPALDLPIYDKSMSQVIAQVSIKPGLNSQTELTLSANISKINSLPACDGDPSLLPNGTKIPIATGNSQVLCVPINKSTGRLYLVPNFLSNELIVGVALTISQFQAIGQNTGTANVFLPFNIKGVSGVYGFFTSPAPQQSGLGVFVDASSAIQGAIGGSQTLGALSGNNTGTISALSVPNVNAKSLASIAAAKSIKLLSTKIENTSSTQQKLLRALWDLQSKRNKLTLPK